MSNAADIVREFIKKVGRDYDLLPEGVNPRPATLAALDALVAERDNAVAKGQSRLRCWLFGHDWKRREWHVLGTCDRCGKKEAGS